jgi:hypothetical protein
MTTILWRARAIGTLVGTAIAAVICWLANPPASIAIVIGFLLGIAGAQEGVRFARQRAQRAATRDYFRRLGR